MKLKFLFLILAFCVFQLVSSNKAKFSNHYLLNDFNFGHFAEEISKGNKSAV